MSALRHLRVGLVGAGYVSAYHVRALRTLPQVSVVAVADPDTTRARDLATRFGIGGVYSSLSALLESQPDVVHVLTPPATHCALAVEALSAGCDVLVEKPMAPTVSECDAMIDAARRSGSVLAVNHSATADPIVQRARDLVHRGVCGDVVAVDFLRSSEYAPYAGGPVPAAFRDGGYPLEDLGIHALSLIEAFLGPIQKLDVRYRSTGTHPNLHFDDWTGIAECERGRGRFSLSWSTRPLRNELFIHGTRGSIRLDCFLHTCNLHRPLPGPKSITVGLAAAAEAAATLWNVPLNVCRFLTGRLRPSPGIHSGVIQFYEALGRGEEPPTTIEEGRRLVGWLAPICQRATADRRQARRVNESLSPAKILVTGGSGWLGRALVARLRDLGKSIRVLTRRPCPELDDIPGVELVYGDLGDPDVVDRAVTGVECVYHLGSTMRGRGWADFQAGTVVGTTNIVTSCLAHRVRRLVHVSSLTVLDYAGQFVGATVREDAPLERRAGDRGWYTQAKLQSETFVRDAVLSHGLPAVIVRPGQIVGPGAESISPYGAIALAGRWIVVGAGTLRLPLVHIEDVVEALLAAGIRPGLEGSTFHLVDDAAISQREYIAICRQVSDGPVRALYAPRSLLMAAGGCLELLGTLVRRQMPLSRYRVQSIKELSYDCAAARARLDWQPSIGQRGLFAPTTPGTRSRAVVVSVATPGGASPRPR